MTTTTDIFKDDSQSTLPPQYATLDPAAAKAKAASDAKSAAALEAGLSSLDLVSPANLTRSDTGVFDLSTLPAGATVSIKSEAAGRVTIVSTDTASTELKYTIEHYSTAVCTEFPAPLVEHAESPAKCGGGKPAGWSLNATPAASLSTSPTVLLWLSKLFTPHSKYRVHVTVTVPSRAAALLKLDVSTTHSAVHFAGDAGAEHAWHAVHVGTTNGEITATAAPLTVAAGGFRACLTNGDIRVARVTATGGGEVAGKAVNGTVEFKAVHVSGTKPVTVDLKTINGDLRGTVTGGELPAGSKVLAATVNGNVEITVPRPVAGAIAYKVAAVCGTMRVGGDEIKGRKSTGRVEGVKKLEEGHEVEVGAAAVNGDVTVELTE
ncbi:hypothetical protein H9P43_006241 [Blastocladiella emersonii ATCC 22665]|nr:hypothetical protein H9P43_006241 [Blastocladiella emersonii ATCC 22665]